MIESMENISTCDISMFILITKYFLYAKYLPRNCHTRVRCTDKARYPETDILLESFLIPGEVYNQRACQNLTRANIMANIKLDTLKQILI